MKLNPPYPLRSEGRKTPKGEVERMAMEDCCIGTAAQSQVEAEFSALGCNVEELRGLVDRLEKVLTPVLRCEEQPKEGNGACIPVKVPMAERMYERNCQLYSVANGIRGILQRLEL